MKLMKLAFWRDNREEVVEEKQENKSVGNVIDFPKGNEKEIKEIEDAFTGFYTWKYKGLLDLEEIQKFLDETYYKIGYNNGYNFQTEESLRSGKDQILFDFKNTLEKVYRQKLKHIDEIEIHLSKIEGAVNKYHRGFQNGLQQFSNHQFLPHTPKGE